MKYYLKIRTSGNRTSGDRTSGGPPVRGYYRVPRATRGFPVLSMGEKFAV